MERAWLKVAWALSSGSWCREPVDECDPEPHAYPRLCQARKGGSTNVAPRERFAMTEAVHPSGGPKGPPLTGHSAGT
jgi:hypothetical protein